MPNDKFATDGTLAIKLDRVDDRREFTPGTSVIGTDGLVYVYAEADGSIAKDAVVEVALGLATANPSGMHKALADVPAGQFGWFSRDLPAAVPFLLPVHLVGDDVTEGAAEDTEIGMIVGARPDSTLTLADDAGGRFKLTGNTLYAGAVETDYEAATSHTVTVRETNGDASNSPRDTVFTITVVNVFEEPDLVPLALTASQITEQSPEDTQVGTLENQTAGSTLTLLDDAGGRFKLTGNALVAGSVATDFDTASSHTVVVRETLADSANSPLDNSFVITVVALPDIVLGNLTLTGNTIVSGSAEDTVVGAIQGQTTDSALTLQDDAGGRFKLTGTNVVAGAVATDFNVSASHTVTVRETLADATNSPKDNVFAITVLEPPPPDPLSPYIVSTGSYVASVGDLTVPLPGTWAEGDILVLFLETQNQPVTLPAGWQRFADDRGANSGSSAVLVTAAWRRATASESDAVIPDPGDHVSGLMLAVRDCIPTGTPFDAAATDIRGLTVSDVSFPEITTLGPSRLILHALVTGTDDFNVGWTLTGNANLIDLATVFSQGTTEGGGGGLTIVSGVKTAAGATGNTTGTVLNATPQSRITVGFVPDPDNLTAPSPPAVASVGSLVASTGAPTIPLPAGWQENDILVLFAETANQSVTLPAGWALFAAAVGINGAAASSATRLTAAWKRATAVESDITLNDSGDHTAGVILAVRGCITTGDPFEATATSTGGDAFAGTQAVAFPSVTTGGRSRLILMAVADHNDSAIARLSNVVNDNLTDLTERFDGGTTEGNGGGLAVVSGVKTSPGPTGTTTGTLIFNGWQSLITIALIPDPGNAPVEQGPNYFVDSVAGSDSADGLTQATPVKTLARIATIVGTAQASAVIGLKAGSVFTESLTTWADNLTFQKYGTGADPVIDGFIEVPSNATWFEVNDSDVATSGTNKWKCNLTTAGIDIHSDHHSVIRLDKGATEPVFIMAGSISSLNQDAEYRLRTPASGGATEYLYLYTTTQPNLRWSTIEVSRNSTGVRCEHAGCVFKNIRITGFRRGFEWNQPCETHGLTIDWIGNQGVRCLGAVDSSHYDMTVTNIGNGSNGDHGVTVAYGSADHDTAATTYFKGLYIRQVGEDCLQPTGQAYGMLWHVDADYPGHNMMVDANGGENPVDVKTGRVWLKGLIADTYGSDFEPITVQGSSRDITIEDCCLNAKQAKPAIRFQENRHTPIIKNSALYSAGNGTLVIGQSGTPEGTGLVENSIIYCRAAASQPVFLCDSVDVEIRNNIIMHQWGGTAFSVGANVRQNATSMQGWTSAHHDGVVYNDDPANFPDGYYKCEIRSTEAGAWNVGDTIVIAGLDVFTAPESRDWNGTYTFYEAGTYGTTGYKYGRFKMGVTATNYQSQWLGQSPPQLKNKPTVTINGVLQTMANSTLTEMEVLPEGTGGAPAGKHRVRLYECKADIVFSVFIYGVVGGLPAPYDVLNGPTGLPLVRIAPQDASLIEWEVDTSAAVQAIVGMIPTAGLYWYPETRCHEMRYNIAVSSGSSSNNRVAFRPEATAMVGGAAMSNPNLVHTQKSTDADAVRLLVAGSSVDPNYSGAEFTGTGAGTVHEATGGVIGGAGNVVLTNAVPYPRVVPLTSVTVDGDAHVVTVVASAAHGLAVNDKVFLRNVETNYQDGFRPVLEVIDANTFTYRTYRHIPSGTLAAGEIILFAPTAEMAGFGPQ